MLRISIILAIVLTIGCACGVHAQDAGVRARELAASLDKTKYKKKEKRDVTIEFYIDIKNEVAARSDAAAYSGVYLSDGYKLDLHVSPDGKAAATGYDSPMGGNGKVVNFELRDGRIDSGVLTGVKVYDNGETRKFEGVFVNRTESTGKNKDNIDTQKTAFGLGFVEGGPVIAGVTGRDSQEWTNRVFLERK
jgi:hypothetical protein